MPATDAMLREFFLGFIKIHVLHQLAEAGYLKGLSRVVNRKVRKYYTLTRRGAIALADARTKIGELVGEVLETGRAQKGATARPTKANRRRPRRR
jgi:DNA-binding PadR family transcriptional regulator